MTTAVWPEVEERLASMTEDAICTPLRASTVGLSAAWRRDCVHPLARLIASYAVDVVVFERRPGGDGRVVTTVDAMLQLRNAAMARHMRQPLARGHLCQYLVAIQMFCRHVADHNDRMFGYTDHKHSTDAPLGAAMTLAASDVFLHALCDTSIVMSSNALAFAALAACMLSAAWFGIDGMHHWEVLAKQVAPFRWLAMRAVRNRCLPVLVLLTPRTPPDVTTSVVLTDVQRFHGHAKLALATGPRHSSTLDFYVADCRTKQRILDDAALNNERQGI